MRTLRPPVNSVRHEPEIFTAVMQSAEVVACGCGFSLLVRDRVAAMNAAQAHLVYVGGLPRTPRPKHTPLGNRASHLRAQARRKMGLVIALRGSDCHWCGKPTSERDRTIEHLTRLADGGSNEIDNLSIAHAKCNNDRHRRTPFATIRLTRGDVDRLRASA